MERFLIAVRDLMEHTDAAERLLLCIKQGQGAQGDVDRAPGRHLERPGFVLETACRLLIQKQAHELGLECAGALALVAALIARKELLVVSPSAKSFRRHFKELEGSWIAVNDLPCPIEDIDTIG